MGVSMTAKDDTEVPQGWVDRNLWLWTGETGVKGALMLLSLLLITGLVFLPLLWVMLNV